MLLALLLAPSGKFGLFGLHKDDITDPNLNYAGVGLALLSLGLTILVEPTKAEEADAKDAGIPEPVGSISLGKPLLESVGDDLEEGKKSPAVDASKSTETWVSRLGPEKARVTGVVMALIMGCFFGFNFDPAQYLMDSKYDDDDGHRVDPLDYVFSHLVGIFAASSVYYAVYLVACGGWERSWKDRKLIAPAMLSGVMWAIAQVCWFVANGALGFSIAFPLITSGPGLVAAFVGIMVFGEIKGARNFAVLGLAFTLTVCANVCIVMSR